ncbi:MAG: SURF1 family protein [Porticoccaceae bacterium]
MPLTVALGLWQLHRAEEKRGILAADEARANAEPVSLADAQGVPDKRFLRVRVTGTIDNERVFLVDNRVRHGRPGYEVVSPFHAIETGRWLLVNRGWIAGGLDRRVLPPVPLLPGIVTLTGYLYQSPGKPFVLGSDQWQPGRWPQIVQHAEPDLLAERLGQSLFPYVLRLDASASPGLETGWEVVNMPPGTHIGYAVQWFALALALVILTIFANSNLTELLRRAEKQDE